jgi:sigma-E factor negative regulatory protein RseB
MTDRMCLPARRTVTAALGLCLVQMAGAHTWPARPLLPRPEQTVPNVDLSSLGVVEWLQRMHAASRQHSYIGTFVVSASAGNLSSARIWHACEGNQQVERIEALSGSPRSTFRHNDRVLTFLPDSRVVKSERRENLELFPNLLGAPDSSLAALYSARLVGRGRVAGFDADVVQLTPGDPLRFGYRIWSERNSGLVIKLQTIDGDGGVVEQSAFLELQLDAPLKIRALAQMMNSTAGFRMEQSELQRVVPESEGWTLKSPVAGFKSVSGYSRVLGGAAQPERTLQWIFSDGLASVSLFLEPYDAQRPLQEAAFALGATSTLTRRIVDRRGDWWLTAVGEVPVQTLDAFAQSLARTR